MCLSRRHPVYVEVVGGSDIAEPFNISSEESIKPGMPGMVVSIDPERTGESRVRAGGATLVTLQ